MQEFVRILYCHCAHSRVVPEAVKEAVLQALSRSGAAFDAVEDLCELAARRDPILKQITAAGKVKIAACHARAVKWLFAAGQAPLPEGSVEIFNMRVQDSASIIGALLPPSSDGRATSEGEHRWSAKAGSWVPWFPVIDYDRCIDCRQCLSFCLFGVYGVSEEGKVEVQHPEKCKTNCPACARVCPEVAIIFPKFRSGAISGDEVRPKDLAAEKLRIDPAALVQVDIRAALRGRGNPSAPRFSGEPGDCVKHERDV